MGLVEGKESMINHVSILGCGWYGSALAAYLLKQGFQVSGSATSSEKVQSLQQDGINSFIIRLDDDQQSLNVDSGFWDCDALVIASNVKLAANSSYLSAMRNVADLIKSKRIKKVILVSSTSVYGDHNGVIDESTTCEPETTSGAVLLELEGLFQGIEGVQSTALRFGGLVGPGRLPGSFFAGKKEIANGSAPVNLIHLEDCLGVTALLLRQEIMPGKVNGVSPDHPTRAEFYTLAARKQHLEEPEFVNERLNWKIVQSSFLEEVGYEFRVNDWRSWLHSL